jgi:Na+/proline symporter
MTAGLIAMVCYLAVQLGIGVWISRRVRSESDYLIAGRRLGYTLATFSIFATWFGAETIMGSGGRALREGVSLSAAEPFGYGLCLVVMALVFARPLWNRQLTTLADLFRVRYSVTTERVAAVIMIPSSVLWAAAQVRGFGYVVASGSALTVEGAIGIAALFTVLYTMFGGLWADAATDVLQSVILLIGLVILFIGAVWHLGGPDAAAAVAVAAQRGHAAQDMDSGSLLATIEDWAIPVCGSVVAAELVSRIIAARSPVVARRSALGAAALYLVFGMIPLFIGLVGAQLAPTVVDAEQVVPAAALRVLPTIGYAVFAGALISAVLSTVDSTLLVSAGLLSHNLVVPLAGITDERKKLRIARWGVLGFGLLAYVLALHATGVFVLVEQASAFGSAGALITIAFGLFSRFGGAKTALATLGGGMLTYIAALALGTPVPFLSSLAASLTVYVIGGVLETSPRVAAGAPASHSV